MIRTVLTALSIVVLAGGAGAFGETSLYTFVPGQSTVTETRLSGGIEKTYLITGRFQLKVDFEKGRAWFDWVDAALSEGAGLDTRDLGELFYMSVLHGSVVDDHTISFVTPWLAPCPFVRITVTIENGSARLTGWNYECPPSGFSYELDAVAIETAAGWTYHYSDDFTTDKAEEDSYSHSVFWPREAFPPPEPYLYYSSVGGDRGLVFAGYGGEPAHLAYCFPLGPGQSTRPVRGRLEIDVRFPSNAEISQSPRGYLLFSTSDDGIEWTTPKMMTPGQNRIPLESVKGSCYVIFLGTRVLIDDLDVYLVSPPATIHVPKDFSTIQGAIDFAADGDIVEVAPGVYDGPGNFNIEFRGKAITVRSSHGPEQTVIDCSVSPGGGGGGAGKASRGFYFHESEKSNSIVSGFTIRAGRVPGSEIPADDMRWNLNPAHPIGAGIYCEYSSPTIVNCVVTGCGTEVGGGIGVVGGAPTIVDCLVENCTAGGFGAAKSGGRGGGIGLIRGANARVIDCVVRSNAGYFNSFGGGIYCRRSSALISNCEISFNNPVTENAGMLGGGVYCAGPSTRATLRNCVISYNGANYGAGIYTDRGVDIPGCSPGDCPVCNVRVTNCTVAHNRMLGALGGPFPRGAIHSIGTDIVVKNSIVWYNEGAQIVLTDPASNSPVLYCDVEGGYLGQGNIDEQPLFAPVAMPDYHLQSRYGRYSPQTGEWVIDAYHSPCIDAGDPKDPVGGEPMPNGGRINMGAYGGTRQASKGVARIVYHVDGVNGNDSNSGLSRQRAFATIQRGINATKHGDVVMVWPAVYVEEVDFGGKAVTVQSASQAAAVVAPSGYAFSFFKGEGPGSVLRNFIIRDSEYAIFCSGSKPTISNLTVVNNEFGIAAYDGADPKIVNCIFWNNASGGLFQCETVSYSRIQPEDPNEGEGNITDEPLFVEPNNADYHLRSEHGRHWPEHDVWVIDRLTSPCIDAGNPAVYPRRERTPNGGRLNMGAYGGTAYASMSEWTLRADLNRDGLINMKDLAILADSWLDSLPWAPLEMVPVEVVGPLDGVVIPAHFRQHGY
ncbi:MAG: right-handed parallel beta-helix repeat-containing protein [Phycisphaerales bacterium]|nr:MAG: right-handed parallel beta-helix repeat-containing protein [Phycisphaerales bacterium]